MNQSFERCLTTITFAGWMVSMGALLLVAVQVTPENSRPVQTLQRMASQSSTAVRTQLQQGSGRGELTYALSKTRSRLTKGTGLEATVSSPRSSFPNTLGTP